MNTQQDPETMPENSASDAAEQLPSERANSADAQAAADHVCASTTAAQPTAQAMPPDKLRQIIEAALLAADQPMTIAQLGGMFNDDERPATSEFREALALLDESCRDRGVQLTEVASGFRLQVRAELQPWISRLWPERQRKYSRALLETLALIAYRQPITRAEIEDIRGVSVSTNIIRTLLERDWIRELGHRDVPGRPVLYGSTKGFLDHFNMKSLEELPSLAEIRDIETLEPELELQTTDLAYDKDSLVDHAHSLLQPDALDADPQDNEDLDVNSPPSLSKEE
ncbi:MAG: SMC-Scp complex subunit ScpB [Gammaproteobacteria bacterium]|jgi:segregation and condensation protein B|nr:SMC-Scp complex subunit ScpB [Gammaproteobacteria bacterium]